MRTTTMKILDMNPIAIVAAIAMMAGFTCIAKSTPSPGGTVTKESTPEFRFFSGEDGKTFRGRIQDYNPDSDIVILAQENGQTFRVDLRQLPKADQTYVREWHLNKEFFTRIYLHTFTHINRSRVGTEFLIWRPGENVIYDITLENQGGLSGKRRNRINQEGRELGGLLKWKQANT
jgi:hypothetical protein